MNPMMKVASASAGIVMLVGLAYYQGRVDQATGQEDKIVGTVIAAPDDRNLVEDHSVKSGSSENEACLSGTGESGQDHSDEIDCESNTGRQESQPRGQ